VRNQAASLFAQARPGRAPPSLPLCPGILIHGWETNISHQTGLLVWIVRMTRHAMHCPVSLFAFEMQPYLPEVPLIVPVGVCRA